MRPRKWGTALSISYYVLLTFISLYCGYQLKENYQNKQIQKSQEIERRENLIQRNKGIEDTEILWRDRDYREKLSLGMRLGDKHVAHMNEEIRERMNEEIDERMKEEFRREIKDHEPGWMNDVNSEEVQVHRNNNPVGNGVNIQAGKTCSRNTRIVYIKTHKTGSCTTTNMLYRFALKYDVPTLLFTFFPYPLKGINKMYVHKHSFLEKKGATLTKRFHLAADHMYYEREEFDKVMEGEIFYTTTLRNPPAHLRSVFSYFDIAKKAGIPSEVKDPVEEYIFNKDKYPKVPTLLENRNADMLGFDRKQSYDLVKVRQFIEKLDRELGFVMITEYSAESYIVLRRKMCWDISDILYLSINIRKYKNQGSSLSQEALQLHKQWNNVDYILYDHYNKTLWTQIAAYGQDFQEELILYKKYLENIQNYCDPLVKQIHNNVSGVDAMRNILEKVTPLKFPDTNYGSSFQIDVLWCVLTRVNIMEFYNIMRVKQFPALCDFLAPDAHQVEPHEFKIKDKNETVGIWPGYCAKNKEGTLVPLESAAGSFNWWSRKLRGW